MSTMPNNVTPVKKKKKNLTKMLLLIKRNISNSTAKMCQLCKIERSNTVIVITVPQIKLGQRYSQSAKLELAHV